MCVYIFFPYNNRAKVKSLGSPQRRGHISRRALPGDFVVVPIQGNETLILLDDTSYGTIDICVPLLTEALLYSK